MKKSFVVVIMLVLVMSVGAAQKTYFNEGTFLVTPQVGLNSYTTPFGASVEVGITENIGVGGTVMMWFWEGFSLISPAAEVNYHFTSLEVDKLDVFAGAGLGTSFYSGGDTGVHFYVPIFAGARYYFDEKIAVMLKLNFSVTGNWSGASGVVGVTFKLK